MSFFNLNNNVLFCSVLFCSISINKSIMYATAIKLLKYSLFIKCEEVYFLCERYRCSPFSSMNGLFMIKSMCFEVGLCVYYMAKKLKYFRTVIFISPLVKFKVSSFNDYFFLFVICKLILRKVSTQYFPLLCAKNSSNSLCAEEVIDK